MFGKKDSIKEFEQMRQALKPAERFATRVENETETGARAPAASPTPPAPAPTPAPVAGATKAAEECATVLSSGTAWQGNLKTRGSVRVEGQLTGEIDATDTVYVLEGAQVDARIRAAFVVLAGQFKGEVHCGERLEIMPTGQVRAELTTKSLVVHEGAFMEGQIHMAEATAEPAGSPAASPPRSNGAPRPADRETKSAPTSPG